LIAFRIATEQNMSRSIVHDDDFEESEESI